MWKKTVVIAAGAFRSTTSRTVVEQQGPSAGQQALSMGLSMMTGLPISVGPKRKRVEKKIEDVELRLVLDILEGPPRRWFRIEGLAFDYTVLGAEKEMSALNNFRKLILRFAAQAKSARLALGTLALLKNQPLTAIGYEDLGQMERESRWLFALGAAGS
jgi:hypothetical protein